MSAIEIFILVVALVVTDTVAFRIWLTSSGMFRGAAVTWANIMPAWAAQGPFQTGTESAVAMRYAWLAVWGDRPNVDEMADGFAKHAKSFDRIPSHGRKSVVTRLNRHLPPCRPTWRRRNAFER